MCLKSKSKDLYFAAIENLVNASDNYGPAINKHLPILLPLVAKRQDLANDERIHRLKDILAFNGGDEAEQMLERFPLKWGSLRSVKISSPFTPINTAC